MRFNFLTDNSRLFQAADPYAVAKHVAAAIGHHELRLSNNKIRSTTATLAHRRFGEIDLCHLSYGQEVRVLSEGLAGIYHLQLVLKGHCRYELGKVNHYVGAGQGLVINPDQQLDIRYSADCEKFILALPSSLLRDVCLESRWPSPEEGIHFDQTPRGLDELDSLPDIVALLCREAEKENTATTPQIQALYNRLLGHKLLSLLPHNVSHERACLTSSTFKHLELFIEQNLKRNIGIEDLVKEAQMSRRSLYLLFDKHAKTTPKNFIRQKKLEAVYNALINPAYHVANITALALDYGFTHLGRFSEIYREAFGILPSDSLKERQLRKTG